MVSPSSKSDNHKGNHSPHTTTTVFKSVDPEEVPAKGTFGSILGCQTVPPVCSSGANHANPHNNHKQQPPLLDPSTRPSLPTRAATAGETSTVGEESIWTSLLSKLRPGSCFADTTLSENNMPSENPTEIHKQIQKELQMEVPLLLQQILITSSEELQKSKKRKDPQEDALQRLYKLTDLERKANRVPMMMSNTDWNVANHLAVVISNKSTSSESRRLACLTLNNLSIPFENKYKMALDTQLLERLLMVIRNFSSETYLCCICFFNMSFEERAKQPLLEYPKLLLSLEQLLVTYTPILVSQQEEELQKTAAAALEKEDPHSGRISKTPSQLSISKTSIEGEAVRWTLGLLRNLTTLEEACTALSQTQIISEILKLVQGVAPPHCEYWQKDSLEDFSLQTLTHLAQHTSSLEIMKRDAAQDSIGYLMGQGGIHDFRASMITAKLKEQESTTTRRAAPRSRRRRPNNNKDDPVVHPVVKRLV